MIKSGCTSSGGAPTPLRAYNRPTGTHPPPHHQGERWGMERPVSSEHQPRPARGTPPPGRTHLPTTATSHEAHDRPPDEHHSTHHSYLHPRHTRPIPNRFKSPFTRNLTSLRLAISPRSMRYATHTTYQPTRHSLQFQRPPSHRPQLPRSSPARHAATHASTSLV
jgi:hypothetical protein